MEKAINFIKNIMAVQKTIGALEIRVLKRERWLTKKDSFRAKSYYITGNDSAEKIMKRVNFLNDKKKFEVYYGLNLRKEHLGKRSGKKSDVIDYPVLFFADIDILHGDNIKNLDKFEKILDKGVVNIIKSSIRDWVFRFIPQLENAGFPPLAVIYTGWGVQFIFLSSKPIPKKEYEMYQSAVANIINKILSKKQNEFMVPSVISPYVKKQQYKLTVDRIYNVDRILRLPGFYNWRYSTPVTSEVLFERFDNPQKIRPQILDEALKEYKKELEKKRKYEIVTTENTKQMRGYSPYQWKGVVQIADDTVEKVVKILSKYWIEGQRHDLSVVAAGFFRAFGYTPKSVEKVFKKVCIDTADPELENRLMSIKTTYEKPPISKSIRYSIRKFLIEKINESNIRADAKKRKIEEVEKDMRKLRNILLEDVRRAKEEGRLTNNVINGKVVNKL